MTPADAIIILYVEICEAMKRAGVRVGAAPCEAPAEAVIASAIVMFLDKSPSTKSLVRAMLDRSTEATHLRQN